MDIPHHPGTIAGGAPNGDPVAEVHDFLYQPPPPNQTPTFVHPTSPGQPTAHETQGAPPGDSVPRRGRKLAVERDPQSLQSWLRSQNLQPGVCHYQLRRLHPIEWADSSGRMVPTAGIVEERQYNLIDESYLLRKWGGNVWEVNVYRRNDQGKEKFVEKMPVELASSPVAYLNGSQRCPLDPKDDPWTRNGRERDDDDDDDDRPPPSWRRGDGGPPWRQPYQGPPSGFAPHTMASPLAGLADLATSQRKVDVEQTKMLMTSLKEGQARIDEVTRTAMDNLQKQVADAQRTSVEPLNNVIKGMQDQVASLAQRYEVILDQVRKAADTQLDVIKTSFESNIRQERDAHKNESERAEKSKREEVASVDARWKAVIEAKDRDLVRLEQTIRDKDTLFRSEMDRTVNAMKSDRDRDVTSTRDNLLREINDLKERHAEAIKHARQDADRRADDVGKRVDDLVRHQELVKAQWDTETRRLQSELDAARNELALLRSKANPDPIAQINTLVALREGLEGAGIISAPSAGDNFKETALKQIGSFAAAMAERLAKPQYVVQGPAPGVMPQQYPQQQTLPAGPFQPPQPVPVQAGAIRTPRPTTAAPPQAEQQPAAQDEAQATEQVVTMFQYVEQEREKGTPPETLAATLIASTSPEAMKEVLGYAPEILMGIAIDGGIESLNSPAADRYVRELRLALANTLGVPLNAAA